MQSHHDEFTWTGARLEALAGQALERVRALGVAQAYVALNESRGISVQVRERAVSSQVAHGHQRITLSAFSDGRTAQVSSANLSADSIERIALAAAQAVKHVERDEFAGPAEARYLAAGDTPVDALGLFHHAEWSAADAIVRARETEEAAFGYSSKVVSSEGASCNTSQMQMVIASTEGLLRGYRASFRSLSCAAVASDGGSKRIGSHGLGARSAAGLDPRAIGTQAAAYAVAQLGAQSIDTRTCAVLYDATVAVRLLGQWLGAASGQAVATNASFLAGKIGAPVIASHLSVLEDPGIPGGLASRPFDSDGIAGRRRALVDGGTLTGYLLSAYWARRLKMTPTGNADGIGNVELSSAATQAGDDLAAMLRRLGTGFYVTGLSGGGFNGLTGEYSQGAEGFWVENGEIAYPVDNVTLAGHVSTMFGDAVTVGADRYTSGALTSGSILAGDMRLAGR